MNTVYMKIREDGVTPCGRYKLVPVEAPGNPAPLPTDLIAGHGQPEAWAVTWRSRTGEFNRSWKRLEESAEYLRKDLLEDGYHPTVHEVFFRPDFPGDDTRMLNFLEKVSHLSYTGITIDKARIPDTGKEGVRLMWFHKQMPAQPTLRQAILTAMQENPFDQTR